MKKVTLLTDIDLCIGCLACETACKQEHNLPVSTKWMSVIRVGPVMVGGRLVMDFVPMHCRHCENPPCMKACPVEAITKRPDGIVLYNEQVCIGCKQCIEACPFGAAQYNPDVQRAQACNLCVERVDQGLLPVCAQNCPTQALVLARQKSTPNKSAKHRPKPSCPAGFPNLQDLSEPFQREVGSRNGVHDQRMTKYVAILGTLDTKGREIAFLREAVRADGGEPLVVDTGVLGTPTSHADVSRQRVAQSAGSSIEALIEAGDKSQALVVMAEGTKSILQELLKEGQLGGVLSIGGGRGTALGTQVMQSLPVGVPKLMVSTMASGRTPFGPYTGTRDVTLMHSVADLLGVNAVTRPILTNAAAAIVAMSRVGATIQRGEAPTIAATMLGASTALVTQIHGLMAAGDAQVIAFHAVGAGGRAMEELVDNGLFDGVFDVSPGEISAWMAGGPHSAGPDRMKAASRLGIPQVVAPGGLDFIIEGPPETVQTKYPGRKTMNHTPTITLVRTSLEEITRVAEYMAERLAESAGPAAMILPLRGFSAFSTQGEPLYDPQSDAAFLNTFRRRVPSGVRVVELDTHLNDPEVGETAVSLMRDMLAKRVGRKPRPAA